MEDRRAGSERGLLTCGVEAEQQGAGDGEGQDPDRGDHHKHPLLGAMAGVVHDGHHDGRVPADTPTLAAGHRKVGLQESSAMRKAAILEKIY